MTRKISQEKIKLIERLFEENLSVKRISREEGIPYSTVYRYTRLKKRGFNSGTEYEKYLVSLSHKKQLLEKRGFRSSTEYEEYLIMQRINPETGKPYRSLREYKIYLARQRQLQPANQKFSSLIKQRLSELGKNPAWLARELGIKIESSSRLLNGENLPKKELQQRLFKALELPYKTLEEILD